jgi:hypothetical protein
LRDFDGSTYDPEFDRERLNRQYDRVFAAMQDGRWHTLSQLHARTGDPEASISARLRDMRKPRFGEHIVDEERVGDPKSGIHAYRLTVNHDPPRVPRKRVMIKEEQPVSMTETKRSSKKEPLINRHRPQTWKELLGHLVQIREFQSAVKDAQVFLITGISGVGKTTFARVAAKHHLKIPKEQIRERNAADLNGADDARNLVALFGYSFDSDQAVILDEVQRFTRSAWDILLKFLEEPPEGVYIFLCTTEYDKIPDNIKNRCVELHLQRVGTNDILKLL